MAIPVEWFTKSFSSLLGLKLGIFLAGTSTNPRVFGLRPIRAWRRAPPLLLLLVSAAAVWQPARRATRVDPVTALRFE